jgi:hypothetical protein
VYRTYVNDRDAVSEHDRGAIERAVAKRAGAIRTPGAPCISSCAICC